MKAKMPLHLQELDEEYGLEQFKEAQSFFKARGINIGYSSSRRPGWFLSAMGRADGPTTVICWCGLEGFIDLLDSPFSTIKSMTDMGADLSFKRN